MTKRLIVHVGPRKTGSTSIQRMLFACRDKLRANGVHVPETGVGQQWGHPSHLKLVAHPLHLNSLVRFWKSRLELKRKKTLWKQLAEEIAVTDAQTFVVSAEDLSSPSSRAPSARLLAEFVAHTSVEVDVLGFVRPQWQLLESEYSQRTAGERAGGVRFSQFVAKMLDAGEKEILDYRVVFAPYRARFGNRVRIFPLDTTQNLIEDFLTFVGIDATVVKEHLTGPKANQRCGAKVLEVYRCVRARLGAPRSLHARKRHGDLRHRLHELPTLLDGDAPFAGFSQTEIQQMENRFASANAAFAHESGISIDGTLFHNTPASGTRRQNVARWEDFSNEEKHRVRRYVLERIGVDLGLEKEEMAEAADFPDPIVKKDVSRRA